MPLASLLDLVRTDGTRRRFPHLPPSAEFSPAKQAWLYASDQHRLLDQSSRVGSAFTLDIPGYGPIVGFSDEDSVKRLLAAAPTDVQGTNDIVAFFVGPKSIFLLDGEPHANARARTLAAFSGDRMRGYAPVIAEAALRKVHAMRPGERISGMELGRDMALEVILRALFGLENGPSYDRMHARVKGFLDGGHNPLSVLLSLYVRPSLIRALVSGERDPKTMRLRDEQGIARLTANLPGIRAGRELIDALVDLIDERRARLDEGDDDALGFILRKARDAGHTYDMAEAVDETLTLLLAGHDTTAISLSWAIYRIVKARGVIERIRAELDEAFPGVPIDAQKIERLPYLGAVVDESFRLDGIGRGVGRRLKKPMRFGEYDLPAGTIVLGYAYAACRNPAIWEFPDDFVPDQILGKRPRPHEYAPFGGGYRRCAGAAFATLEMKILLAVLLRHVDFAIPPGVDVKVGMLGPVIAPIGPVPLDVVAVREPVSSSFVSADVPRA